MAITNNKNASQALMVAVIVVCLLGGGARSVAQKATKTEKIFFTAEDGQSGQADCTARAGQAANLAVVAGRYLPEDDETLTALTAAIGTAQAADGVREVAAADAALTSAFENVYLALGNLSLSASDETYRQELRDDFTSYGYILRHNDYNTEATAFNQQVRGAFPGRVWAALFRIEPLPVFQ